MIIKFNRDYDVVNIRHISLLNERFLNQVKNKNLGQKNKGCWGENLAKEYLISHGVNIIGQNFRCEYGEIDIIGYHEDMVIFFEVKTRFSKEFGFPEVSINKQKVEHMKKSAMQYIQNYHEDITNWRIDVIAITKFKNEDINITWFKNAINE